MKRLEASDRKRSDELKFYVEITDPDQQRIVREKLTFSDELEIEPTCLYKVTKGPDGKQRMFILKGHASVLFGQDFSEFSTVSKEKVLDIFKRFELLDPFFKTRDYQVTSTLKALVLKKGILQIATGGGKTEIISAICQYLLDEDVDGSILIMNDRTNIINQINDRLVKRGVPKDLIKSTVRNKGGWWTGKIILATVPSVHRGVNSKLSTLLRMCENVHTVIFDEGHHLSSASTWSSVLSKCLNLDRMYAFSGTPWKSSGDALSNKHDANLIGLAERVIVSVDSLFLRARGYMSEPFVYFIQHPSKRVHETRNWKRIYDYAIERCTKRTEAVVPFLLKANELKIKTLVIVSRIRHGEILLEMLHKNGVESLFSLGGESVKFIDNDTGLIISDRCSLNDIKYKLDLGINILIGSSVYDEGVDIPEFQVGILMGGGKSMQKSLQRVGRVSRPDSNLNISLILDFWDSHNYVTLKHSRDRLGVYESEQFKIIENENTVFSLLEKISMSNDKTTN